MKLSPAFLFIGVVALCFAAGRSESASRVGQNSASSAQGPQNQGQTTDGQQNQDPQIDNGPVAEYVSDSNCTVGWSTRVPATMTLQYGTDPARMKQTKDAVESNDGHHYHVRLDGLTPSTRYYFHVLDAGKAISGVGTFQTVAAGDPPIRSKAMIPQ